MKYTISKYLNQTRLPGAWNIFQSWFGATSTKSQLVYKESKHFDLVIEVGCSTGLIAQELKSLGLSSYIGIDVDHIALAEANDLQLGSGFEFKNAAEFDFSNYQNYRTLVVLSHVIHHLSTHDLSELFIQIERDIPESEIYILEPELKRSSYSWWFRFFYLFENGEYRRSLVEVHQTLIDRGYAIASIKEHDVKVRIGFGRVTGTMWSIRARKSIRNAN